MDVSATMVRSRLERVRCGPYCKAQGTDGYLRNVEIAQEQCYLMTSAKRTCGSLISPYFQGHSKFPGELPAYCLHYRKEYFHGVMTRLVDTP